MKSLEKPKRPSAPSKEQLENWLARAAALIDREQAKIYAEMFPDDPVVLEADRGTFGEQALVAHVRMQRKRIPMDAYFDAMGLHDGYILNELKKHIECKKTAADKNRSLRALEFLVKYKHAVTGNADSSNSPKIDPETRRRALERLSSPVS